MDDTAGLRSRLEALAALLDQGQLDTAKADLRRWIELSPRPMQPPSPPHRAGEAPTFTICMATYNRAAMLPGAIESALGQSYPHFEYIIIDDGSTDETAEIVARYAADPRLKYLRRSVNMGRPFTRNEGISEATGEFVFWMADDDLILPDTLERYAAILAEHPEIDVIYGILEVFDGETGAAVDRFDPSDFTDRDEALVRGKLQGSCIPDPGTATRRSLYAEHGAFDTAFWRAQDYEFWTRIVGSARFYKLDDVVYRYRKHDGAVSFDPCIDMSYESVIIRRHLDRHPWIRLLPHLPWQDPDAARTHALLHLAGQLYGFGDPFNAERLLDAVPELARSFEHIELRCQALVSLGQRDAADALLAAAKATQICAGYVALAEKLAAGRALVDKASFCLRAQDWTGAGELANALVTLEGGSAAVHTIRARALEGAGDLPGAVAQACVAFRWAGAPLEGPTTTLAERLIAQRGGTGAKVDLSAMRERLHAPCGAPPPVPEPVPTWGPKISVVLLGGDTDGQKNQLQDQLHTNIEIVGTLAESTADYVAFLTPGARWRADHLARCVQHLRRSPEPITRATTRTEQRDDAGLVTHTDPMVLREFDRDDALAGGHWPLASFVFDRRAMESWIQEDAGPAGWAWLMSQTRRQAVSTVFSATVRVPRPAPDEAAKLLAQFRCFEAETLFNRSARTLQNERLAPFEVRQTREGRAGIVLVLTDADPDVAEARIRGILTNTHIACELVVVADRPDEPLRARLKDLRDALPELTVVRNLRPMGLPKALNQGLAKANGERVAFLRADIEPPAGWLGRALFTLEQQQGAGLLSLADDDRIDSRMLILTRGLLDRIGGFDAALEGRRLLFDDLLLRAQLAGFGRVAAPFDLNAAPDPADSARARERFVRKWGAAPTASQPIAPPDRAFDPQRDRLPFGPEAGFLPGAPPITLVNPGRFNVICRPPAEDAALDAVLSAAQALGPDAHLWLRSQPDAGMTSLRQLERRAAALGIDPATVNLRVVDAALAPDREAGLYTAAHACLALDAWPDSDREARRAADCGRPVARDIATLCALFETHSADNQAEDATVPPQLTA